MSGVSLVMVLETRLGVNLLSSITTMSSITTSMSCMSSIKKLP